MAAQVAPSRAPRRFRDGGAEVERKSGPLDEPPRRLLTGGSSARSTPVRLLVLVRKSYELGQDDLSGFSKN